MALMAETPLGGRGDQGVAQQETSALQGIAGRCQNPPPKTLMVAALSLPLPMTLLPGAVPARNHFPVPMPPPCQCSQTPTRLLCAQLCPADPSWQQGTAQGQLSGCRL